MSSSRAVSRRTALVAWMMLWPLLVAAPASAQVTCAATMEVDSEADLNSAITKVTVAKEW
ncbi:MAG: hypothetical protein ACR2HR_11075 [Euzebya sp.]